MILSGKEIARLLDDKIVIRPYRADRLNPNSYNLSLHNELVTYDDAELDMKKRPNCRHITIPEEGYVLEPGRLYLARTAEYTETHGFVPMLEGRSSIGRLGMFVHITAGFGDVGFCGYWTLEIAVIHPVRIYAGVDICQIFYHTIEGDYVPYKSKKYQNNTGIQPSLLYKDFTQGEPS